ncbi:succinate dehydrogenase assembly factor 4, mitochondrial-like [Hylaeus volcanicus]|uniref:succinate dehydrogenase assembly factor 4, mitochondrial-like n=1 Tax=Hylaeus volcanicus TaxID=313075 RepID=UPI0023B871C7|nr:succinate dehydrogenase assembly factor 4, mitochondrial-like [Hylaeus volcanicus]
MYKVMFNPNVTHLRYLFKVNLKSTKCLTNSFHTQYQILFANEDKTESPRLREFRKKLRERTPIEELEELEEGKHPYQEKEPLKPFPNNTNPKTGEVGGPKGPEPTRYGDWERKGRVTDF